ncbi:MAG: ABC transporter ATP-binding protein [Planctomycetes bacterium]|nr:ABC transporter ATP-binding protein [Planctomycetota bacterium]
MIQLQNASLSYDLATQVLDKITLSVGRGEFVSLLGPSGCGKSTLLRLIAGLVEPSHGQLTVGGQPARRFRQTSNGISLVFQEPRLLPWRNVTRNIALPLELSRVDRADQQAFIEASLELIGLGPQDAAKYPRMLSGGMRMRVALARALVTKPSVLLLDEPFSALDELLRQQLNEELLRIWRERAPTTVFVTHNVSEAIFLSQRVVVMADHPGRIKATVDVPFEYPRSHTLRATREFATLVGEVSDLLRVETT